MLSPSPRSPETWLVSLVLFGCALFVYFQVFILPGTPRVAVGDQCIYLHNATRMYEGQLIYRDFDYFTLPGTDILYFCWFKLFGVRLWIPQAMLILGGVISTWLGIKISSKIIGGRAIFLPSLLFLTLPYSAHLDATHHLFNAIAATGALAVVLEERTPLRVACSGFLWGLGTCFAQSLILGPITFALFLFWEHGQKKTVFRNLLKKEFCLWGSYVAMVAAFASYFVWKAGWKLFFYCTVTVVAKYYSTDDTSTWRTYMVGWPAVHTPSNWPDLAAWPLIHFLIPLVYILFFVRYWREKRSHPEIPWERLVLVNVTGLCLFLTIASAPSWNRMYTVSLPATIMLVWFLQFPFKLERALQRILWALVLLLLVAKPVVTQTRWRAILDLPTGRVAFFDVGLYEKTKWVMERTQPSEYFFGDELLDFALRLRNPSRVAYVTPYAFTRPEEVFNVVEGLEAHKVRFVSWYPNLDAPVNPSGNSLSPLRRYLMQNYHIVARFPGGSYIWERTEENKSVRTLGY